MSEWKEGDELEDVPPEMRWLARRMQQAQSPEEQAKRRKAMEEMKRQGDMRYEVMPRYHLERSCMKCGYGRYSYGPDEKVPASQFIPEGMLPLETGHHDALARRCRRCNYVWFERTEEDEDEPGRRFLLPVHELAGVISDVYLATYKSLVTEEFAPLSPSELADAIRKELQQRGHAVPQDGAQ